MPKLKENPSVESAAEQAMPENRDDEATDGEQSASEPDPGVLLAIHAASEKKAIDPVVLDLRPVASFTDHFLIVSGTNARQVQAITDGIVETLKADGVRAARVEGYATAEWVLIDYGSFIVHIFDEKSRRFYDLERLWRDARRVEIPAEAGAAQSSLKEER